MPSQLDLLEAQTDNELGQSGGRSALDQLEKQTDAELSGIHLPVTPNKAVAGPERGFLGATADTFRAVPAGANAGRDDLIAMVARAFGDSPTAKQVDTQTDRNLELAGADHGLPRYVAGAGRSLVPMLAGAPLGPVAALVPGVGVSLSQASASADEAGITGADKLRHVFTQGALEAVPELVAQRLGLGGAEKMLSDAFRRGGETELKAVVKELIKAQPQEVGTELVTSFGQAGEDKRAGIDQSDWSAEQAANLAVDTTLQTLLLTGAAGAPRVAMAAMAERAPNQSKDFNNQRLAELGGNPAAALPPLAGDLRAPADGADPQADPLASVRELLQGLTNAQDTAAPGAPVPDAGASQSPAAPVAPPMAAGAQEAPSSVGPIPQGPQGQGFSGYAEQQPVTEILPQLSAAPAPAGQPGAGSTSRKPRRTAADEPALRHGMVRMYHGGVPGDGARWATTDRAYAQNYADKSTGEVQFVDVPADHPAIAADPITGDQGETISTELPESLTKRFRPLNSAGATRKDSLQVAGTPPPSESATAVAKGYPVGTRVRFTKGAKKGTEATVASVTSDGRPVLKTDDGKALGGKFGISPENLEMVHDVQPAKASPEVGSQVADQPAVDAPPGGVQRPTEPREVGGNPGERAQGQAAQSEPAPSVPPVETNRAPAVGDGIAAEARRRFDEKRKSRQEAAATPTDSEGRQIGDISHLSVKPIQPGEARITDNAKAKKLATARAALEKLGKQLDGKKTGDLSSTDAQAGAQDDAAFTAIEALHGAGLTSFAEMMDQVKAFDLPFAQHPDFHTALEDAFDAFQEVAGLPARGDTRASHLLTPSVAAPAVQDETHVDPGTSEPVAGSRRKVQGRGVSDRKSGADAVGQPDVGPSREAGAAEGAGSSQGLLDRSGDGKPGSGDAPARRGNASGHGEGTGPSGAAATGDGRAGQAGAVGDRGRDGRRDGGDSASADEQKPAADDAGVKPTPENPTDTRAGNWSYTSTDFLASGLKSKFKANLAAIQAMRAIKAEGRTSANDAEQEAISKYVGWGQFPALFNYSEREWQAEREQIRGLMSAEEWDAAQRSTLNAHYTAPEVVKAHWQMAQRLGFTGGRFLETSAGIGYYQGFMPADLAGKTKSTLVELDNTTGGMLGQLYPHSNVQVTGLQDLQVPDNFYDLVASNVPFGDYKVHDPKYNKFRANIHDYFFLKSLDLVRPGGLVMHITSTGTMDKADAKIREALFEKADLVAAIRFPSKAHKANAGTDVVTDLLILKKRETGAAKSDDTWIKTTTVKDPAGGEAIPVNAYFAKHSEQILGTLDRTGSMYHGEAVNVSKTADYEQRLQAAIARLPEGIYQTKKAPKKRFEPTVMPAAGDVKDGGYAIKEGKVYLREGGSMIEQKVPAETKARIAGNLAVRDALRSTLNDQLKGESSDQSRKALNRAYDAFTKRHGPVNDAKNKRVMGDDPDWPLLSALENWNKETQTATKTDVFTKDTISAQPRVEKAGSVGEALGVVLNETGALSLARVAELTGKSEAKAAAELQKQGLAYDDPREGWKPADQYLSGNVRQKLIEAKAAAASDTKYQTNVDALVKVQPDDVPHDQIDVKVGSSWVPPADVTAFAAHLMESSPRHFEVHYIPSIGTWTAEWTAAGASVKTSQTATTVWGTKRKGFIELLDAALNNKSITIYDKGADDKSVVNVEETAACATKVQEIKTAFREWVWEDDARRQRLHRFYNDNFNNIRPIAYSGKHLSFPGKNPAIQLRGHQVDFVWQVITTGKALAAHEVGTGKTFSMVASAMELRRLGLARKPMIACLKANVGAVVKDALTLYPGARVLYVDSFTAENRKRMASRIATGDWDLVVMTHDNLNSLPMRPETTASFIKEEIRELEAAKEEARAASGKKTDNRVVKQLEKAKLNLEVRLKDALDESKKDDAVFFEETGIDQIFVDEAHKYKSLPVYTKQDRVKGIPTSRSDRATSMLMRTRWLMDQNGGRGVVFATGTPVANTMAELYTMQRYLQPQDLKDRGLWSFDAWASTFGDLVTQREFTVTGEYKPTTRFARFVNIPELMAMVRQTMDVRLAKDMKKDDGSPAIVRPDRKDEVIISPSSTAMMGLMDSLQSRAKNLKNVEKDNMLAICTDGRKGALDMRLYNSGAEDNPHSKVNLCVNKVLEIHKARPDVTQMIFSDLGVNANEDGFSVYADIIGKLVAGGIPRKQIADFSKLEGEKKDAAVSAMKEGKIVVAIGSSDRLGTGVNAQDKLATLHHLDVPWLPAYVEQRDGRGWRQGNQNKEIQIIRYVAEGSLDQTFWQVIANKTRFIKQVIQGEAKGRNAADEDTEELSPEELMAAASGDPRVIEKVNIDADVAELKTAAARHDREQKRLRDTVSQGESQIPQMERRAADMRADAQTVADHPDFALTIDGKTYADRAEALAALTAKVDATQSNWSESPIGTLRGLDIVKRGQVIMLAGKGGNRYEAGASINSLESVARNIATKADQADASIPKARADLDRVRAQVGKAFPKAEELKTKRQRAADLEKTLSDESDQKNNPKPDAPPADMSSTDDQAGDTISEQDHAEAFGLTDHAASRGNFNGVIYRVPPAPLPSPAGVKVEKLADLILDFGKSLTAAGLGQTAFTNAGLRSDQRGVYKPASGQTAIRHNNLDAAAHEIAHRLDDFFPFTKRPDQDSTDAQAKRWKAAIKELSPFSFTGSMPPDGLGREGKNAYLRAEGFAEFVRALIVNPDETKTMAPTAYALLHDLVPKPVMESIEAYSHKVRQFVGLSAAEKTRANVRGIEEASGNAAKAGPGKLSRLRQAIKELVGMLTGNGSTGPKTDIPDFEASLADRIKFGWFDSMWPAIKAYRQALTVQGVSQDRIPLDKDYETLARLGSGLADRMDSMFVDGLTTPENEPVIDEKTGERMNLDWLLEPAKDGELTPAETAAELDHAMAQGIEERTVEEGKRNLKKAQHLAAAYRQALFDENPDDPDIGIKYMVFLKLKVREARLTNSKLTGIAAGLDSDYEQARRALRERRKSPESKARRSEILRRYRAWANATLDYAVEAGVIGQDRAEGLKHSHAHYIDLHRVMEEETASVPVKAFKGSSRLIDNPLVNLMHATYSTIQWADRNRIRRAFTDALSADRGLHQGSVKDLSSIGHEITEDEFNKRDDAGKVNGQRPYKVWVKGEDTEAGQGTVHPTWWVFDPAVEASFQAAAAFDNPTAIGELLHGMKRLSQKTITSAPPFLIRQVFRDTVGRLVTTETGSGLGDLFKGYGKLDDKSVTERYKSSGAGQAGWDEKGKEKYQQRLMGVIHDAVHQKGRIVATAQTLGRGYMKLAHESDMINRRAEFVRAWKKAKAEGKTNFQADLYAAKHARGLMDFAIAGYHAKKINQYVVFFNAGMQALRRGGIALKPENRASTALRWAIYAALPTALMYAAQAALMDDKDREEWRQRPSTKRDYAWSFKVGNNLWIDIPKPYEWGAMASGVERALDVASGHAHAGEELKQWLSSVYGAISPFKPEQMVGSMRPFLEAAYNHSTFTGRPIVPQSDTAKDLDLRKGTKNASEVGQALQNVVGIDARKIDHLMTSVLGGYGRIAAAKSSDPGWWLGATTGLTGRSPSWEARDVEWVNDWADSRGIGSRPQIQTLRDKLHAASSAKTPEEVNAKARDAREYATKLRAIIEKNPQSFGGKK